MTQAQSKSYGGVKKKLMGAICMLLVASIMVVSSTYAWFTLSTAPEITGISTSVGANGNLEMALLNTETYADMTTIKSAVGDSSAVAGKSVTASNITWGNLVNLDDQSYGLDQIKLMPAALSVQTAEGGSYKVDLTSLLGTPVYGADGRVVDINGTTYTGTWNTTANSWAYSTAKTEYGVRAIGANDNLTAQQAGLLTAKSDYNKALTAAKSIIQNALTNNGQNLASAVTTLAMNSTEATISTEQQTAIQAMVTAADGALKQIDLAYIAVLKAAATTLDSTAYTAAIAALGGDGIKTYTDAVNALKDKGVTVPQELTTAAGSLTTQKAAVTAAQAALGEVTPDYKTALTKLVDTTKVTINGYNATAKSGEDAKNLMVDDGEGKTTINPTFMTAVITDGGAMVEMPDGSGVFAYIGSVAGNYAAATQVTIENFKGLTLKNMPATIKTTATVDTTVSTALNTVTANGTSSGNVSLSNTYGYALDMAFRTNAASSYLKLQTAAAQRVYSDGSSEATQGGGSTMTFTTDVDDNGNAVLKEAQVVSLMQAIRVAFIDPDDGTLYGIATLENITTAGNDGSMKGELTLKDVGDLNTTEKTFNLDTRTANNGEEAKLMQLEQNAAKKLTVLVYLDGHGVDNGDVANAASSMTGTLNLQFSSSAKLQPMENTALRNMEKPAIQP